jgi:hypothetical protein
LLHQGYRHARAVSKLARSYTAAGYNKDHINALLGTAAQYLDKPAPPAGGAPKANGQSTPAKPALSVGDHKYKGGDPRQQSCWDKS